MAPIAVIGFKTDLRIGSLRGDPRFAAMLAKIHLS
jgi:hypothetical protein